MLEIQILKVLYPGHNVIRIPEKICNGSHRKLTKLCKKGSIYFSAPRYNIRMFRLNLKLLKNQFIMTLHLYSFIHSYFQRKSCRKVSLNILTWNKTGWEIGWVYCGRELQECLAFWTVILNYNLFFKKHSWYFHFLVTTLLKENAFWN